METRPNSITVQIDGNEPFVVNTSETDPPEVTEVFGDISDEEAIAKLQELADSPEANGLQSVIAGAVLGAVNDYFKT